MKSEKYLRFKEFVSVNRRLMVAVIVSLIGVLGLQSFLNISSTQCLGIADSKESTIAYETPVVVKRIFVIPGQAVKKGQPLVEVEPVDTNMRVIAAQTELESLQSERKVRDTLLGTLGKSAAPSEDDPLARKIAGMQKQVDELKRQQGQAVRYAEEDGSVATVAFRPRDQVPPFTAIITLNPDSPNLVYGFIHESRLAEFKLGDHVIIEPVSDRSRFAEGKVISLGSRITPFPERFQMVQNNRPTFFGRELVVSLPLKNQILIGEKVQIRTDSPSVIKELGFQAFADSNSQDSRSVNVADHLPFEAGGMVFLPESKSLLIVSDEERDGASPFWLLPIDAPEKAANLEISGIEKVDDLESITQSGSHFYAMSSLSRTKKDKVKKDRNLILRFKLGGHGVQVDRALDMRSALVEVLRGAAFLRQISADIEDLEIEGFTMSGNDGYMALKKPRLPDGSSVVIRIDNLAARIENQNLAQLEVEMYTIVKLDTRDCENPARITDMIKTDSGLYILSNCKKSERIGQLWFLANNAPAQQAVQLATFRRGRPEGLAFGPENGQIFVSSDNGADKGSDLLKMTLTEER
jgi:multidrug resistance efflux pump